jgi:diacylglycerol kinase
VEKFLKGFGFAFKGLIYAFKTQLNFKVHTALAVVIVCLGWYYNCNSTEWLWILLAISSVLIIELINTAIEVLTDLVSPAYHPKAGIVKDVSAAAVLIAAFFAVAVGLIILVPKIF